MPIKYFCDECGIEVYDPSTSLDMTGKILCLKHYQEHEQNKPVYVYKKVWDQDRFQNKKLFVRRLINGRLIY